ncbi:MAG: Gldg family protein, partial [Anaerolineae bacterium]|nr:Gldg family protein [Anaerolineae bacterium]
MKWTLARRQESPAETQGPVQARRNLKLVVSVLLSLLVVGTFLINVVVMQLGERFMLTVDLTANAAYEAGEETRALLQSLDQDVEIYVLATEDAFGGSPYFLQAQRMIEQYPKLSPRVRLTYVDYVFDPTFASRYPDLTLSQGDVLVVRGDRVKQLQLSDLLNYNYTQSGNLTIHSSRAEE